jgi:hypothetical protein
MRRLVFPSCRGNPGAKYREGAIDKIILYFVDFTVPRSTSQ